MDRKYYSPIGSYLTPEQIRHEEESISKIVEKYRMSDTGLFGTYFGVGGVTFLALKGRGLITKVLVSTLTGGLTTMGVNENTLRVSVFFQMIIIS